VSKQARPLYFYRFTSRADMLCTALHGTGKSSNDLCATGPGMTQDEYRTQFSLWCMWSSPMALSFDPRSTSITDDDYAIMKNKEMIALNQDRMGAQADLVSEENNMVIFAKDCENGDIALSFTNLSSSEKSITLDFNDLPHLKVDSTYTCRDLWEGKDIGEVKDSLNTTVKSHATKVFRLAVKKNMSTGIKNAANNEYVVKVTCEKGNGITVDVPSSQGISKRVLVSDTFGRVVATANLSSESTKINLPEGVYVVNVICNAKATSTKVKL